MNLFLSSVMFVSFPAKTAVMGHNLDQILVQDKTTPDFIFFAGFQ